MKYIIKRTSAWDEKPIPECVAMQVHKYDYRLLRIKDNPNNWKAFCNRNTDIQNVDGHYRGTNIEVTDVWVAEVQDLHEFVLTYGEIILDKPCNAEGLWEIEIYDDYRE